MSVVLIVEDVPAMRQQYAYDLHRLAGHETREAATVGAAQEILLREPIDCVLLDLELPGADGFALLETLREQGADVPVLVYTGTGDYERCVTLDGVRYGHILDPRTGWPVRHLASVSVVADLCVVAGSASTIAMLKQEKGPAWLTEQRVPHHWIDVGGRSGGTL